MEVNALGCQRTVAEWQHVWEVWRGKVKTKARKVRDHIGGTGGGPAMQGLSDADNKILEIIGPASVYGFASQEQGLPPADHDYVNQDDEQQLEPQPQPEPQQSQSQSEPPEPVQPARPRNANPARGRASRRARRLRVPRPPRPPANDALVRALRENDAAMRETIQNASDRIASALREGAEILARAVAGALGVVQFVQEQEEL